jgi:hypothetical protein
LTTIPGIFFSNVPTERRASMSTHFELVTKTADGGETVDVIDFEKIVRLREVRP